MPLIFGRAAGWTLVELAVVLVIGAIVAYFVVRNFQPKQAIALEQAEQLRNDLRHMQTLAMTWGQPLRLTVAANLYSISCVTAGAAPCNVSPVVDPATGKPFSVNLESGLTLAGPTLDMDAMGRPSAGATFTISGGGTARTVVVAPITGFVTAQ